MGLNEKFFKSSDEEAGPLFNTVLYTGNSTARAITGVGFEPDLVWIKKRNSASNSSHMLFDIVRGVDKVIITNSTQAEYNGGGTGYHTSFDTDGFSITGNGFVNSSNTFVAWCFKAGGAAVPNTDGSIASQVSANVANGFSIVKYSGGNSSGTTVGHGLSSAPELIINKNTSKSSSWPVFVTGGIAMNSSTFTLEGSSQYLSLNGTNNFLTYVFDSQLGGTANSGSSSQSIISYCFHSVAGVSKVGSYTGNGLTTNGPVIDFGFEPSWIMIKSTSFTERWVIYDNKRSTSNPRSKVLTANSNATEIDTAYYNINFTATGFTVNGTAAFTNRSGETYIYYAIA